MQRLYLIILILLLFGKQNFILQEVSALDSEELWKKKVEKQYNGQTEIFNDIDTSGIEKILIVSEPWKYWTNPDSTGLVFDLVKSIFENYGICVEIKYLPYDISIQKLLDNEADIAVGVYENEVKNIIYPKWNFAVDNISAVYLKKESISKWNCEKSIENMTCGFLNGYSYNKYFSVPIKIKEMETREELFNALNKGKIDFYLDSLVDIDDFFLRQNINRNDYCIGHLKNLKIYFGIQNTEKGKKIKEHWDNLFKKYFYNSSFRYYYEKWQKGYNFKVLQTE